MALCPLELGPQTAASATRPPAADNRPPINRPKAPYRLTEKRLAASYANLRLAHLARKRDRSPNYAPGFLRGYQAADPARALPLSGATLDEYEAHLAVYAIGLHPVTGRQEKLALATAMVSWKWLTGMRLYGDSEVLGVWECLARLAQERQAGAKLTPGRLMQLVRELNRVFERWLYLDEDAEPLDHRLLQLLRQGIVERGRAKDHIRHLRSSRLVENFGEYPAEVLASPRTGSKRVTARLAPEPAVRPARKPEAEAGVNQTGAVAARRTAPRAPATVLDSEKQAWRAATRERRQGERQRYTAVRRARQAGVAIPGEYKAFVRRVEAALGVGAGNASRSAGVPAAEGKNLDPRSPACAEDELRGGDTVGVQGTPAAFVIPAQAGIPDADAALVREIAAALWQRLTVYRRYAEKLERELSLQLIAWGTDPSVLYDRQGLEYARELAWEVVAHDFGDFAAKAARAASAAAKRMAAGFYALSVERWGGGQNARRWPRRDCRIWASAIGPGRGRTRSREWNCRTSISPTPRISS